MAILRDPETGEEIEVESAIRPHDVNVVEKRDVQGMLWRQERVEIDGKEYIIEDDGRQDRANQQRSDEANGQAISAYTDIIDKIIEDSQVNDGLDNSNPTLKPIRNAAIEYVVQEVTDESDLNFVTGLIQISADGVHPSWSGSHFDQFDRRWYLDALKAMAASALMSDAYNRLR